MNFYRRHIYLINTFLFLLITSGLTYTAIAWSNGKTGQTQAGCTCHSSSADANTKVTLTSGSGSFTFEPNSETTFTVGIDNSAKSKAGMNVGVKTTETSGSNVGSLTAGNGTKIQDGEVTHNDAQTLSSGKFNFTFDWTAPSAHGEYWIRGAANAVDGNGGNSNDAWNRFTTQKIVVAGVTVLAPNGGESWCVNTTQTIEWDSDGLENVKIEVSTNGGSNWQTIEASTSAASGSYNWTIPGDFTVGNNNQIRVSDASKASRNDISQSSFTVSGAVTITMQPQSQETCTTQEFSFSVETSGSGSTYQWRKDGQNINGATQSIFSRASANINDAADYDCKITTACGDILTSEIATLEVFLSPTVALQPSNVSGCEGDPITLEADITGDFSSLQWLKNNQPINGATNKTYVINSLKESDEGTYKLTATSQKCGNEISTLNANVTLNKPASIATQPTSKNACEGSEISFSPKTSGTITAFQWYRNDEKVSGAISRDLTITDISLEDAGEYKLEITGACGDKVTSEVATLSINSTPTIATQPANKEVFVGSNVTLSVSANNPGGDDEDLTYQWKKDGAKIDGATDFTYTISNIQIANSGNYTVEISNKCNLTKTSETAVINVLENNGGASITSNVDFINFLEVAIDESKTINTTDIITNTGDEVLVITALNITGADASDFTILSPSAPLNVNPNESISLELQFTASKEGLHQADISFESNSVNNVTIPISGIGLSNGSLTTSVSTLDFGEVVENEPSSKTFSLNNPTLKDIEIISVETLSTFFTAEDIGGTVIAASNSIEVMVTFVSDEAKDYTDTLIIKSNDGKSIKIPLIATALKSSVSYGIPSVTNAISFPNPSNNSITFEVYFNIAQSYNVRIVDMNGNTYKRYDNYSEIGKNLIVWNTRDSQGVKVVAGTYFAILQVGDKVQTLPFVVK